MTENESVVERAIAALRGAGAAGEVFLREQRSETVELRDGAIESTLAQHDRGIGVRVLDEARAGFAYTSDLSQAGIDACVETARAMARVTEPDPHISFASARLDELDLGLHRAGALDSSVADKLAAGILIERTARAVDPRISGFRKTSVSAGEGATVLATTSGAWGSYRESSRGAGTSAIATQGDERQIGWHGEASRLPGGMEPADIGRRAAEMAIGKLGARSFPTQTIPIVLDPWMGMQLLGAIGALFSADSVLKGKSLFAGKSGERVASDKVTIVDDARLRNGLRSAPFDGEGTPTQRRTLIRDGVLESYLGSIKTARKMGIDPPGNARRGSYAGPSRIAASNLSIAPGADRPSALVDRLARALRITALLNLHTIDPISGEFSLGAAGDYLEQGAKQYGVQGITIAGNLVNLLGSIDGVGDDLTFGPSGLGSPTLIISALSVGGT